MSDQDQHTPETTPTDYAYAEAEHAEPIVKSRWPKVFGIISLIYALGGLVCAVGAMGSPWISVWLVQLSGASLEFPQWLKYMAVISGLINFVLGLILFFGAIGLLRRRRSGVKLHKVWAVIRVVIIMLGFAGTLLLAPQNIEFQRQMVEFGNEQMEQAGRGDQVQEFSDEELWTRTLRNSAISSAVLAIYPLVVGFYMARRKIEEEVDSWDEVFEV